ncbi:hypothetical protein SBA5_290059 [Candidatus Sulfotelmatomonas gaucii]|uniref:Uncharacterized protein n=1 Tax=Candidatus Sulfuritelmatomonas gaucii TaxID=2043161 RepID=A0A2N9LB71_9BACT|nr:hypothetical protein SBA5_290059 [Candidatus Sulfotelmatomonas gaucii]
MYRDLARPQSPDLCVHSFSPPFPGSPTPYSARCVSNFGKNLLNSSFPQPILCAFPVSFSSYKPVRYYFAETPFCVIDKDFIAGLSCLGFWGKERKDGNRKWLPTFSCSPPKRSCSSWQRSIGRSPAKKSMNSRKQRSMLEKQFAKETIPSQISKRSCAGSQSAPYIT